MLGCRPAGRYTEQHDIFFGIGENLKDLIPKMKAFWSEAKGKIHVDVWREVTFVDGFSIEVITKEDELVSENQLFFINLGGYKELRAILERAAHTFSPQAKARHVEPCGVFVL